ncbi:MAG: ATP-binding protein [Acetobacteraceae bacterium]
MVFETADLMLGRVDDIISGLTWEQIASPSTSHLLARLKKPFDQAVSVWVTDSTGTVRAGSQPWNPGTTIESRDFFAVHRERETGDYVSSAFVGRATGIASFALSRGLKNPDGTFAGTIHVSLSPDYFTRFFAEAAPALPHMAALIRRDGPILASEPSHPIGTTLSQDGTLLRAFQQHPGAGLATGTSVLDGAERVYAYRKVARYPVYVAFGVDTAVIASIWYSTLIVFGSVAAAAAVLLFWFSWHAYRGARAANESAARLQATMETLQSEISQREAAEQRVRQTQKMEAVGQLTGGIAHDFNNLLTAILGSLELLRKRLPQHDASAVRLLNNALDGAHRGAALTQRLLAFGRRQTLQPEPVDIAALVDGMQDLLRSSVGAGVQLKTEFPPDLPRAYADTNQLELALLNLAVNARDAMKGTGQLTIAAQCESAGSCARDTALAGGAIVLRVIDTGMGMDEATLARATEPFFTTKGVGKGTGLGLSMVHGMAGQSGGKLILKSRPGEGTTAELWLPRAQPGAQAPAQPVSPEPERIRGRHCRILLVDDDSLVLQSTALLLEDLGHTVLCVPEAPLALDMLGSGEPVNLVVTDQAMPGMTGLQLAAEIRRRWPYLPVLLATGLAEQAEVQDAGLPILSKPFVRATLEQTIRDMTASRPAGAFNRHAEPLRAAG